jgi:hypothetical protein
MIGDRSSAQAAFPTLEWFEDLRSAAASDPELAVVGQWCTIDLALVVGEKTLLLHLREGSIGEIVANPDIGTSWDVTLRGTKEDWDTFLRPTPPPLYTDLLAMNSRVPSFSIEGNRRKFVRHLRALGRIFAIAQAIGAGHARV